MGTVAAGTNATAAQYNDVVYLQNYIMNSNFNIWQRGTTSTNPTTNAFLSDRWRIALSVASPPSNIIHSRQALTPGDINNAFYFYRINPDGAGTFNASEYYQIEQRIEHGTRLLAGASKTVTLSFYAKSSIGSKKLGFFLSQNYGTGGTPTSQETINGTYVTLSSSWVKYTQTFTLNTLVGKTFGTNNDDYLRVCFMTAWGSDYTAIVGSTSTLQGSGNIDIAQVQLTIGDTAMEYKPKLFGDELVECMRYYEKSFDYSVAPAQGTNNYYGAEFFYQIGTAVTGFFNVRFKVKKRVNPPSITTYNVVDANDDVYDRDNGQTRVATNADGNESGFTTYLTSLSGTNSRNYLHWSADAEI